MNPHIFREYDIRGIAGTDLDAAGAETLGRAFGTLFRAERRERIVVGHDVRVSSPAYAEALVHGLVSTGCEVLELGLVPTPVLYFAVETLGAGGGIAVTASHNPPEFNGFKSRTHELALFGADLQRLLHIVQEGEFASGRGTRVRHDILDAYVERVAGGVKLARPLHAVVDCGNGAASVVAPRLLERLGCRLDLLYCDPDGRFPNHIADPTVPEYMRDLCDRVPRAGADLGIAFDGDADRVGIVDDGGRLRFGDELLILFARALLPERPGPVVFDVKCSQALVDEVRRLGGRPEMWKTGYPHIQARMRETGALLAGEMSGHLYFADRYYGYDDGIYAACRALEVVSAGARPIAARLADVPRYVSTPEIRVDSTDADKFRIVAAVAAHFRGRHEMVEIDGVRILFPRGWALVRASNTQPVLVLRFEADSRENLERIQAQVRVPLQEAVGAAVRF